MLKMVQTPKLLRCEEISPIFRSIGFVLLAAGGLTGAVLAVQASGGHPPEATPPILALAGALLTVLAGIGLILRSCRATVLIDREKMIVALIKRGAFARRKRLFKFSQIKYFRLDETDPDAGLERPSVVLELHDGNLLTVTAVPRHVVEYECRHILMLNEFVRGKLRNNRERAGHFRSRLKMRRKYN